jgi:hypothetical protein
VAAVKMKTIPLFLVTMVSLILVLAGCGGRAITGQATGNQQVPLLDKEIPARLETATFALG